MSPGCKSTALFQVSLKRQKKCFRRATLSFLLLRLRHRKHARTLNIYSPANVCSGRGSTASKPPNDMLMTERQRRQKMITVAVTELLGVSRSLISLVSVARGLSERRCSLKKKRKRGWGREEGFTGAAIKGGGGGGGHAAPRLIVSSDQLWPRLRQRCLYIFHDCQPTRSPAA